MTLPTADLEWKPPQTFCCHCSSAPRWMMPVTGMTSCFLHQWGLHCIGCFHFFTSSALLLPLLLPGDLYIFGAAFILIAFVNAHFQTWSEHISCADLVEAEFSFTRQGLKCNIAASHPINCFWRAQLKVWRRRTLKLFTPKTSKGWLQHGMDSQLERSAF